MIVRRFSLLALALIALSACDDRSTQEKSSADGIGLTAESMVGYARIALNALPDVSLNEHTLEGAMVELGEPMSVAEGDNAISYRYRELCENDGGSVEYVKTESQELAGLLLLQERNYRNCEVDGVLHGGIYRTVLENIVRKDGLTQDLWYEKHNEYQHYRLTDVTTGDVIELHGKVIHHIEVHLLDGTTAATAIAADSAAKPAPPIDRPMMSVITSRALIIMFAARAPKLAYSIGVLSTLNGVLIRLAFVVIRGSVAALEEGIRYSYWMSLLSGYGDERDVLAVLVDSRELNISWDDDFYYLELDENTDGEADVMEVIARSELLAD